MRLLSMGLLSVVPERKHYSGGSALHAAFCGEMVQGLSTGRACGAVWTSLFLVSGVGYRLQPVREA